MIAALTHFECVNCVQRTLTKLEGFDCDKEITVFNNAFISDGLFRDSQLTVRRGRLHGAGREGYVKSQSQLLLNNLKSAVCREIWLLVN